MDFWYLSLFVLQVRQNTRPPQIWASKSIQKPGKLSLKWTLQLTDKTEFQPCCSPRWPVARSKNPAMSSVQNTCSKGDDLFRQHLFRSSVCQILSSIRNFWGEANLVGFVLRHLPIGPKKFDIKWTRRNAVWSRADDFPVIFISRETGIPKLAQNFPGIPGKREIYFIGFWSLLFFVKISIVLAYSCKIKAN